MKTSLFPVVHIHERSRTVFAYSYDVAEVFGRTHGHVMRDIRHLKENNPDFAIHVWIAKYLNKGKKLPCFRISETGVGFLITQARADKNKRLIQEGIEYKYRKEQLADRFSRQQVCIEGFINVQR